MEYWGNSLPLSTYFGIFLFGWYIAVVGMSLIYRLNSVSRKIEACGTPAETGRTFDVLLLKLTSKVLC